ncbi:hypothetical protein B0H11DRAFT_2201518 [Mycena galericulata]|nr:hypothetical protein B0H11DRAFT_2201518 [Mycena galericulata]
MSRSGSPSPSNILLNSNEFVKKQIEATKAKMLCIETQISGLARALQTERRTLARLWMMITPMGKLPTELLVEIFTHSVQSTVITPGSHSDHDPFTGAHTPTRQALLLSQVCPYWRQIVNSTPKFWNAGVIDVHLAAKRESTAEKYIDGLETLLARSAPLPISVSFTQDSAGIASSAEALALDTATGLVFRAMSSTTHRWKSLKVDGFSFKPLTSLSGGTFPTLESLDVKYNTYGQNIPLRVFYPAPRLQRLALVLQGSREYQPKLLLMPWPQLTHLKLTYSSLSACREILLQCTNLVSAELSTTEWDFEHPIDAAATVLPFMEVLKVQFDIGNDDIGHVEPFLAPLSLPSLLSLDLTFDPAPGVFWPVQEFSAFQRRCPQIVHVALTNCPLDSGALAVLLRLSPAISSLKLKNSTSCINSAFLRQLKYDDADDVEPLGPQLRQLHWEGIGYEFGQNTLEEMIRSRWWTDVQDGVAAPSTRVARLEKVLVSNYSGDSMSEELIERMRDVVGQGLDLQLSFPYS